MQFTYAKEVGESRVRLDVREYAHIFKVRRVKSGSKIFFRNFLDDFVYTYEIEEIGKKEAFLNLLDKKELQIVPPKYLHVGWSMVDSRSIEKNLAMLNEIGVSKITFFHADFSQKQFQIDSDRMMRILTNSCEQCGRSSLMEIEILKDTEAFFAKYPQSSVVDFSPNRLENGLQIESFVIGPEGGFSKRERKLFENNKIFGFDTPLILRSESAVVSICAKLLL